MCEKTDCMKVGRGGHVGMEEEAGRLGGRKGVRLGRHSGSGHGKKERKKTTRRQL